jgi:hypothetical protein
MTWQEALGKTQESFKTPSLDVDMLRGSCSISKNQFEHEAVPKVVCDELRGVIVAT